MSLFCQNCGQEHLSYVEICPGCGQRQHPPPAFAPEVAPLAQPAFHELRGVGGWLLLLCISLTFIGPATQAIVAEKALRNLVTLRVPIEAVVRFGSVAAIYTGLAIFSCIAGVMLWMENPKGLSVAKAYLLVAAVLPISLFLLLHLAGMHVDLFRIIFKRLLYAVIWYSYLSASLRVKLTYGVR